MDSSTTVLNLNIHNGDFQLNLFRIFRCGNHEQFCRLYRKYEMQL